MPHASWDTEHLYLVTTARDQPPLNITLRIWFTQWKCATNWTTPDVKSAVVATGEVIHGVAWSTLPLGKATSLRRAKPYLSASTLPALHLLRDGFWHGGDFVLQPPSRSSVCRDPAPCETVPQVTKERAGPSIRIGHNLLANRVLLSHLWILTTTASLKHPIAPCKCS